MENQAADNWVFTIETIFGIYMVLQFFKEFQPEDKVIPVRDLYGIAINYFESEFLFDFLPILPLQVLNLKRNRQKLFFLIKCIRIPKGF